jgi:predicted DNA-binding transcriptional regulator AlpA
MKKPERDAVVLPPQLETARMVSAAQAAAYWGVSLPHWRRLYRAGRVPHPIKLGWRARDLLAAIEARRAAA